MMTNLLFIGGIGMQELIVILVILLLLFGGRKLPELMRGAGRGIREFKNAMSDIEKEIDAEPEQKPAPKKRQPKVTYDDKMPKID